MKNLTKFFIGCLLSVPMLSKGQFGLVPGGTAGRTNPPIQKIAIGNFPTNASVQAKLHVNQFLLANNPATSGFLFRTDGDQSVVNQWQLFTGANANTLTQKFRLFVPAGTVNSVLEASQANSRISFNSGGAIARMHVTQNALGNEARVGIGELNNPLTYLHIGYDAFPGSGFRNWMNRGVLMYGHQVPGTNQGSDNMYVGLREVGNDITEATINWGNNPANSNDPDRLVFRFTAATGTNLIASGNLGVETARMISNGNIIGNRMGIGGDAANGNPYTNGADPGNTVEINSPFNVVGPTNSGLRFTDLNSTSATMANPGAGVLSVGPTGDVIYVTAPTGGGGGHFDCSNPGALLPSDSRFNLNNYNFYFEDASLLTSDNYVGIGHPCGTPLIGKIDVVHNLNTNNFSFQNGSAGGRFINNDMGQGTKIGVRAHAHGPWESVGGLFTAQGVSPISSNTGVFSLASGSVQQNAGGVFQSFGSGPSCTNFGVTTIANGPAAFNYGVNSRGLNATTNYGIHASGGGGDFNYGIYATAWGLNPSSVVWAGYFDGNVWIDGAGFVNSGQLITSDQQFKTNVDTISNASGIITQLQPKTYFYDTLNTYDIPFSSKKQYGFIAQDVMPILPELVNEVTRPAKYDTLGNIITPSVSFKSMNYTAYIALLTKGMQEQQTEIDSLKAEIVALKNCLQPLINQLCGNNNNMMKQSAPEQNAEDVSNILHSLNIELSDAEAIVLQQNVPNPFKEQTTIAYYIPENIRYAQIIFTDMHGRIIKTVDINQTGHGQLKVYASNLSQGIYQYSILVDGHVLETKKMVVEK